MTIRNTYAAESWDKVYKAFNQINFTAYDYDTIKESLIQYLKIYHSESFNDFIESSELIAVLELFAYVGELLAYRVDMMSHENFISTAQRKESILRLAKLISYRSSRNIPARGLVKITSIRTAEQLFDSLGNDLSNVTVFWNDPNNLNWKEQFFLIIDRVLTSKFGKPSKSFTINGVNLQLYTLNNSNQFRNGTFPFIAAGAGESYQMELVPADIDSNGPLERAPDLNSQFNIIYSSDGRGDSSDYTGFLAYAKQGTLIKTDYTIQEQVTNRRIEIDTINVNDTDVWVYRVDDSGNITEKWEKVDSLSEQNLYFNSVFNTRRKYEVETLENDRIALLFGDGNFSDSPIGEFQLWTRVSANDTVSILRNSVLNLPFGFTYTTNTNNSYDCSFTFSLISNIQNNSPSETIEHVRQAAPSTYYAQNRMVNGQDYNTFMLKDSSILKLKTINRTFAGQPKYLNWNDASQKYENIKLFGDDLKLIMELGIDTVESSTSSRSIIDSVIEPLLQSNGVMNALTHILAAYETTNGSINVRGYGISTLARRKFIQNGETIFRDIFGNDVNPYGDSIGGDGSLNEKSAIQAALDQHWYGEPLGFTTINGVRHAIVKQTGDKIYLESIPRTVDGLTTSPPGDFGSGLQPRSSYSFFGLRFNPFLKSFGNGTINLLSNVLLTTVGNNRPETFTIEMSSDETTFTVISNLRGRFPDYTLSLTGTWSEQVGADIPFDFEIDQGTSAFKEGDAFIVDYFLDSSLTAPQLVLQVRQFSNSSASDEVQVNLNGWWQIIPTAALNANGISADGPNLIQRMTMDASDSVKSWIFLISSEGSSWNIFSRDLKIKAESSTTKFWFNQNSQIIDSETKTPVLDKIRILRSNLDENGYPLVRADLYDVVDFSYDDNSEVNTNQLEIMPVRISNAYSDAVTAENILQFENFSKDSYQFGRIDAVTGDITWLECGSYTLESGYDTGEYSSGSYDSATITYDGYEFTFPGGTFVGEIEGESDLEYSLVRRKMVPAPTSHIASNNSNGSTTGCNITKGLDFMWQHFSPSINLVDPSVSNIHDAFILTRGYHSGIVSYIKGFAETEPLQPTPLELRTSYGYLLQNKMLSDTVVLHSGRIKLLFGQKADQKLRAKFSVVKAAASSFSNERIKSEIIGVIDTFFDIQNWDFGDKFYATELISLIHQKLAAQISTVVIVPTYSVNSFGNLFTIDSGFDEILQSCATVDDIEIVDALTPEVIRKR